MKKLFLSFVGAVLLAANTHAEIEIGKSAPAFSLKDCCNNDVSLEAQKGKIVVLEWYNSECPFVKKHYSGKHMQKLQQTYTGKGVRWFLISSAAEGKQGYIKDMDEAMDLKEKNGIKATALLLDHDGNVGRAYGAKTTPHMFIINAEGNLVYAGAIDSDNSTVFNPEAKNYVAQALDELLAGKDVSTPSTQSYGCSVKY